MVCKIGFPVTTLGTKLSQAIRCSEEPGGCTPKRIMGSCASIVGKQPVSPDGKYLSTVEGKRNASITHQQALVHEFTKQAKLATLGTQTMVWQFEVHA